jgi:ATP-dependent exoDNAse (exonuclease V) alpha subunit
MYVVQGMTLSKSFIKLDRSFFADGQAYVALSRVKKMSNLHLIAFDETAIKTSATVQDIYHTESGHE